METYQLKQLLGVLKERAEQIKKGINPAATDENTMKQVRLYLSIVSDIQDIEDELEAKELAPLTQPHQ